MKPDVLKFVVVVASLSWASAAMAASVSEREYKRGYADCLRGEYDQNQHGSSYKRGCRAAEDSGKTNGDQVKSSANPAIMKIACRARSHRSLSSLHEICSRGVDRSHSCGLDHVWRRRHG